MHISLYRGFLLRATEWTFVRPIGMAAPEPHQQCARCFCQRRQSFQGPFHKPVHCLTYDSKLWLADRYESSSLVVSYMKKAGRANQLSYTISSGTTMAPHREIFSMERLIPLHILKPGARVIADIGLYAV